MNKKMFALLVVPVFLIASGALAYSAFSGVASTGITAKAGDITANELAEITTGYSSNTAIYISGGHGSNTVKSSLMDGKIAKGELAYVPSSSTGSQNIVYYLNVSNLAPGNWVEFTFTLRNNGSVGLEFGDPHLGQVKFSTDGLNFSNVSGIANHGTVFTSGTPLSGIAGQHANGVYTYATSDSSVSIGTSSDAQSGYAYAIGSLSSGFDTSLTLDGTADYTFWLGLSSGAGNGYQESSISVPIIISITSDP